MLTSYLTTVPPAAVHSFSDALAFQPMPLQLLRPLHSLLAVLQSEWPLQLFTPAHLTVMLSACAVVVTTAPMENRAAAVLAKTMADLILDDMVWSLTVKQLK
jgi:hypothetical protein